MKIRILSFGYDARTLFTSSNLELDTAAGIPLTEIAAKRQTDAQRMRPIVFMAHSLGGVVVKQVCPSF